MANVTYLHPTTDQPIPVARVLDAARECADVLVLGWTADGAVYAAASTGDAETLVYWCERFKFALLSGEYV